MAVKSALLKLKLQEKLANVIFWGKIVGTESDYLIAKSSSSGKYGSEGMKKKFYLR